MTSTAQTTFTDDDLRNIASRKCCKCCKGTASIAAELLLRRQESQVMAERIAELEELVEAIAPVEAFAPKDLATS